LNTDRPNTACDDAILRPKVLLCGGEDVAHLLAALGHCIADAPVAEHAFRCYRFWTFDRFTVVWTGIGTGCIEPLLFEILPAGIVKTIVLVGTAGALGNSAPRHGKACAITAASAAYCGMGSIDTVPEHPRFDAPLALEDCASLVSTDLYYGFSALAFSGARGEALARFRAAYPTIVEDFHRFAAKADLIDMETAQFYRLCRLFGGDELEYLSIKASANGSLAPETQIENSQAALDNTVAVALKLLGISYSR